MSYKKLTFFILLSFGIFFLGEGVDAASISKTEINLYRLSDSYTKYLTMPSSFKAEEKIIVSGASVTPTYRVKSGETVAVDSTGLVTFIPEVKWCRTDGSVRYCSSSEQEGYTKYETYYEGENVIEVTVGSEKFEVNVKTNLYERYNAEKIMTDYVKNNITSSMTEYQKMEKIMERLSQTNYSTHSSSYVGLFSGEGADCWGDTAAMIYMGELAGLKIHSRDARRDAGAGSGHMNAAVILDGKLYVADVMSTAAPRRTEITPTLNGFSTAYKSGLGNYFSQYDGYDEVAYVPENEYFTRLGDLAFYYGSHNETKVRRVHLPKTLLTVGEGSFQGVDTIKEITVDSANPNFKATDGVLYSKDGTILYAYPSGKEGTIFRVPDGVTTLSASALNGAKTNIVVLPESVSTVGDRAVTQGSVIVKNKNATLGVKLCSSSRPIYGYKGSTTEAYAEANGCPFSEITTDEVKDITTLTAEVSDIEFNYDGNIPNVTIKDGNYTLVKDVDFTLECLNNTHASTSKSAVVKIYGKGKYIGTIRENFGVTPRKIRYTYINPEVDYNGQEQSPIFQVEEAEHLKILYGDSVWSNLSTDLKKYTNPGIYSFGVRISGSNYESVELNDIKFRIRGTDIGNATIKIPNYIYTGSYIFGDPVVTYQGTVLKEYTDYTITYSAADPNIDEYVGPGLITATIKGKGMYDGETKVTYRILTDGEYTLKMNKSTLTLPLNTTADLRLVGNPEVYIPAYKISWSTSNVRVVSVDAYGTLTPKSKGTATITATYGGKRYTSVVTVTDYLKGDLNHDGGVNIKDAMEVMYIVTKRKNLEDKAIIIGDMNNDGKINIKDAMEIMYIVTKRK